MYFTPSHLSQVRCCIHLQATYHNNQQLECIYYVQHGNAYSVSKHLFTLPLTLIYLSFENITAHLYRTLKIMSTVLYNNFLWLYWLINNRTLLITWPSRLRKFWQECCLKPYCNHKRHRSKSTRCWPSQTIFAGMDRFLWSTDKLNWSFPKFLLTFEISKVNRLLSLAWWPPRSPPSPRPKK